MNVSPLSAGAVPKPSLLTVPRPDPRGTMPLMIDLSRERLITLKEAAALVPGRKGKSVSAKTVYGWCRVGHKGRRLESVRRPSGDWLTTAEALGRFLNGVKEDGERPQPFANDAAYWMARLGLPVDG